MENSDSPPSAPINLHITNATELSISELPLPPPPTQTLDQHLSVCRHDHAPAGMILDRIPQPPSDNELPGSSVSHHVEENIQRQPMESSEFPSSNSQPSSPLAVDDSSNHHQVDETEEWISQYQSDTDVEEPLLLTAPGYSNSNSYEYYDVEKPLLVGAGLANLGNTCFLNAVLQCFTHTVMLLQGLYSYTHVTPCDGNDQGFCLFCALGEHIDLSLTSTSKIVSPMKFVDNLSYFSSSFRRFQQEDAHEFLQCFLDRLERSCSFLKPKAFAFSLQKGNLVKQVFGGRVVSKLRCCNCNHCSDTYEPSVDLSLEIKDASNLLTALDSFTKVEHLGDEDMKFTCEKCNKKVSVEKQLMLDQTPLVCALHLKRFKNDGSYVEKIDKHVEFPLELDLQPYTSATQASNVDMNYDLYAVIVHAEFSSTCGHYYCYIRSAPGTWYKFDDSKVTRVSVEVVLSEEAYILFYTKQGTPSFSNMMETYLSIIHRQTLSNTSPISVLENVDHHLSHNIGYRSETMFPESSERWKYNSRDELKYPSPQSNNIKESDACKDDVLKNDQSTLLRPIYCYGGKTALDIDNVLSSSTPPAVDVSDDANTEVVLAEQLNQTGCKRQQNDDVIDESAKEEALKQCRKMPSARGSLLMDALNDSKSEGSLHKRSKKMVSSPRHHHHHYHHHHHRHHRSLISRSLANFNFR